MNKTGGSGGGGGGPTSSSGGGAGASAGGAQVYSFPLLKPSEIFACIREMQIPVAEDEIRACEPVAIRKVLEVFIESIAGATREELNQPAFAGLGALTYPELHEESIPELAFFRAAARLLSACGVYDFGLKDVQTPTPKRVRRQLSALINFAKFREERLAAFGELTRDTDQLLKRKSALQDTNEQLQRQLAELLREGEVEAPAIRQVSAETAALEAEINVLNKRQAVMRHETGELKTKNADLRDEMASYQFHILEAEKEFERLRGKIVSSPARVKQEIESIAVALEAAKEEVGAMERRHRELLAYSDMFARADKDMVKTIELMRAAEQDVRKCKDAKAQVKLQTREIEENRRRTAEILAQRRRLEKLVEQKRELFERFKDESRFKDQAAEQALRAAQAELRQLESANVDIRQRIAANKDASRDVERKMRDDELRYQKELHEIQQMYSRLLLSAQFYNSQLLDVVRANS
ncbi:hypothetical protein PybrP1_000871 [[Pythium] brassicae (nom. inval.)]|nr:hypothetical protein PybrP1_000871 [[Pythium] brassicae (nom. inval.)]